MGDELRATVSGLMPRARQDLERLVRIPSIAFPGYDAEPVRRSAEATAEILEAAGLSGVRLIELPEADHPAVFAEATGPAGGPTVLLYAHHDVQPEGPLDEWDTPPFEPAVRDGRMYGRGTSDDKCGIVMHSVAVRAFEGRPPVSVKVLVEGEEEADTENLPFLIDGHRDLIASDVAVIADSGNWRRGIPTLTTTLRGTADCRVEVRVLKQAVHSGSYGGPIPDALTALCRLLATLHDERGNVAVPNIVSGHWNGVEFPEDAFREEAGVLPGVASIGEGSVADRLWSRPAVSVLGIDAPTVREASNQLVPVARAKVGLRIPPGQDAEKALDALVSFLQANAPWGVHVEIKRGSAGEPFSLQAEGEPYRALRAAMAQAWGRETVDMGSGGSIPLVPLLYRTFPDISVLLFGASDERSALHSVNESVDLGELERAALAEALLFQKLAALPR
jgi:acetylornithine deacetylase/succinyl-diaminopimelate desuccinylase-like protein